MKLTRFFAAAAVGAVAMASFAAPASAAPVNSPATDDLVAFGNQDVSAGNTGNLPLNKPIVGMDFNQSGSGYWEVASDGGVFAYGGAPFLGSMGGKPLNAPIVGMSSIPVGSNGTQPGYYFVASDGGVFAYNAPFLGSMGGKKLNAPIVGMQAKQVGADGTNPGYLFVAADGGVFAYNVDFYGSTGATKLNSPIVALGSTGGTAKGYYFVAADGGVFAYGPDFPFLGSLGSTKLNKPITGMVIEPDGTDNQHIGYYLVAADGGVFAYNAPFEGSLTNSLDNGKKVTGIYKIFGSTGYVMTIGRTTDNYCTNLTATAQYVVDTFDKDELSTADIEMFRDHVANVAKTSAPASKPYWDALVRELNAALNNQQPSQADEDYITAHEDAVNDEVDSRCGDLSVDLGDFGADASAAVAAAHAG